MSWPKEMLWPTPDQFTTGAWMCRKDGSYEEELQYTPPSELPVDCKFCLVGWVRNAFGRPASPLSGKLLPREGVTMLKRIFEELTGIAARGAFDKDDIEWKLVEAIQCVVDGTYSVSCRGRVYRTRSHMSPHRASDVMRRVLRGLGYECS